MSIFKEKQIVALKSNPNKDFPIFEVLPMPHGETRYKVFVDNAFATYYQSQLIAICNASDELGLGSSTNNGIMRH